MKLTINNPCSENLYILENKSAYKYGGKENCGPTYIFDYLTRIKGTPDVKRIYAGKGQSCYYHLFDDIYIYGKIEFNSDMYPLIDTDLLDYNKLVIDQEFPCYYGQSG